MVHHFPKSPLGLIASAHILFPHMIETIINEGMPPILLDKVDVGSIRSCCLSPYLPWLQYASFCIEGGNSPINDLWGLLPINHFTEFILKVINHNINSFFSWQSVISLVCSCTNLPYKQTRVITQYLWPPTTSVTDLQSIIHVTVREVVKCLLWDPDKVCKDIMIFPNLCEWVVV